MTLKHVASPIGLREFRAPVAMLTVLIALTFSSASFAQEGPKSKLFMLPTQSVNNSTSSIIPERIGEQVRQNVGQDGRLVLMPKYDEIRKSLGGSGHSSAAVAEAEQMYTSGIGLLTAGEDKKASEAFQRAVDLMEQNVADIANFNVLSDALSNLALAYHNAGFDADARKRMKQFAHLKPDATLDPEKYPKALVKLYTSETKKIAKGGPGKLEIKANIDGAKVFIDGVEKGVTPLSVDDVGFGHHYLVVRTDTGGVWAEKIRVKGRKKAQTFEAKLGNQTSAVATKGDEMPTFYTELKDTLLTGRFGEDMQPYLKELSTQTGAEYVGWVLMYKDAGAYKAAPFVYRASDGVMVSGAETSFNIELSNLRVGVSELSKTVVELVVNTPEDVLTSVEVGPAPVVASVTPKTTEPVATVTETGPYKDAALQPPPEVPPSEETSTWTYIAAGGGVILVGALVAGTIFLLSDDDNPERSNGFDAVVSW